MYWSKIIDLNLPDLYLAPRWVWSRWNFAEIFGVRKLHCVSKSSHLNGFSKYLHCWKAHEICYKIYSTLPTSSLGMLLHYLGKLKIQIFCICSADMEENAN